MNHDEIKKNLWLFGDAEQSDRERQEIKRHLANCAECRRTFEGLRRAQTVISRGHAPAASEAFVANVMQRLAADTAEAPVPVTRKWSLPEWFFPTLGYSFAFILMIAAIEHRQLPVSTADILMADMPSSSQWAFVKGETNMPEIDEMWAISSGKEGV